VAGIQDNADQSRLFDRLPGPAIRITLCQLFDIVWLEIQVFGIKNKYAEMIGKIPTLLVFPAISKVILSLQGRPILPVLRKVEPAWSLDY
jgi:hypothetical protein